MSYFDDLDVFGDNIMLGMFDIGEKQKEMNQLKQVPNSVAPILLSYGMSAINAAIAGAKQPWYKTDLPGDTTRKNVLGKLQWHKDAIDKVTGFYPSPGVYASGDDLKKWVMQAFIEQNAVEEGSAALDGAWSNMWTEIKQALAKLPEDIRAAASAAVETVTGVPTWLWGVGVASVVVLAGFVIYKMAGPIAGVAARRYLP